MEDTLYYELIDAIGEDYHERAIGLLERVKTLLEDRGFHCSDPEENHDDEHRWQLSTWRPGVDPYEEQSPFRDWRSLDYDTCVDITVVFHEERVGHGTGEGIALCMNAHDGGGHGYYDFSALPYTRPFVQVDDRPGIDAMWAVLDEQPICKLPEILR